MGAQISTLYLLLAAVIGVFIGLLIASLFGSREPRPKQEPPPELLKEGFGEVAELWYSPAGKQLLLEIDGGYFKNISELSKDQQVKAKRLLEFVSDWAVEPVEQKVEPVPQGFERAHAMGTPDVLERSAELDLTPDALLDLVKEDVHSENAEPESPFISAEQEEADLVNLLHETLDVGEDIPEANEVDGTAALTITQQIGAVLDNMLRGTDLEDKGIRLSENVEHGVDVFVGSEKFEGIEAVPYPQVRQVIRDAVLRWEEESEARRHSGE